MISVADLQAYVGDDGLEHTAFVTKCLDEAKALVDRFVGEVDVPEAIVDRAYLEVGSELFNRRSAPNGISQYTTYDGAPMRVARDPMVAGYPILRPYVGGGFA